jgi:ribosome maturation protein Sdo1
VLSQIAFSVRDLKKKKLQVTEVTKKLGRLFPLKAEKWQSS